ncbi:MAG: N-6 DNA methylase [Acidimicrobiales bacterium]
MTTAGEPGRHLEEVRRLAAQLVGHAGQDSSPDLLGLAHQRLQPRDERRRMGVFYTPTTVAFGLARLALAGSEGAVRVCDPACGGGAFLLAAGRVLEARGLPRARIVEDLLWGIDIDPRSVAVTSEALRLWAAETGETPRRTNVVAADALRGGLDAWPIPAEPFDVVIGNPPFQSQLSAGTARSAADAAHLRERLGEVATGYADTASLFLVAAVEMARDGGRVALVLPESFLAARDARPARRRVLQRAVLTDLWLAEGPVFDASVRVCAPVLERTAREQAAPATAEPAPGAPIRRWVGPGLDPVEPAPVTVAALRDAPSWSVLVADRRGVPQVELRAPSAAGSSAGSLGAPSPGAGAGPPTRSALPGRLGDLARATAGFRDQFYGVAPYVREAAEPPERSPRALAPLITSGAIDPLRCLWGRRPVRFAGRRWAAPVVDLGALRDHDSRLGRWADAVLVPKVVIATQTRILEAAVDETGTWWPSVPVVAVTAPPEQLWAVLAVLLAPPVSAWAMHRTAGSALSADAMKLAAREVLEIPLPPRAGPWEEAAALLRDGAAAAAADDGLRWRDRLVRAGEAMTEAYGTGGDALAWWAARLPRFR